MPEQNQPQTQGAVSPGLRSGQSVFSEGVGVVLTSRILPASFFALAAISRVFGLISFLRTSEQTAQDLTSPMVILLLWARASTILFLLLMVVLYVIRLRPIGKSQGMWPKVIALVGTFMMSFVAVLPGGEPGMPVMIIVGLLLVAGYGITILALSTLGRSFSILPEARKLVNRGLYSKVRHPMYLGEMFIGAGMALEAFSPLSAVMFIGFVWAQLQRAKYEEIVLEQVFPDYSEYKTKTVRLIPKLY